MGRGDARAGAHQCVLATNLVAWTLLAGCFDDSPCDSRTELRNGNCVPRRVADPVIPATGVGATCSDSLSHSDCSDGANYCAKHPGADVGYCTIRDCQNQPSICPEGWDCFDLGQFDPSLPWICLQPS